MNTKTSPDLSRVDPPSGQPEAGRSPDEIDLLEYARRVWSYKLLLLALMVVAAAITYIAARQLPPTYETRFRLLATEAKLDETAPSRMNIVALRELVQSPTEIAGLLAEFGLDRPPHEFTAEAFLRANVQVEVIRDTTIISTVVRLGDPDLLVRLARRYAERVIHTVERISTHGMEVMTTRIGEQRDAALAQLNDAERAVQDYQIRSQIDALRTDVDHLIARRPDAANLVVQIQALRARIRQAEEELAKQPPVRDVRAAVDSAATARQSGGAGRPEDLPLREELLNPYANPVYEALTRDLTQYRAQLAGLEQERKSLIAGLELDAAAPKKINRLYQAEAELGTLTARRDIARDAYLQAAARYEEARLRGSVTQVRLQVLDEALPPGAPVAPRPLRTAAAAALVALVLGALAAILYGGRAERS